MQMMVLYNGSNVAVDSPRIIQSERTLDFGDGFYTTTNREQAEVFAKKVFARRKTGVATISVYEMDFESARSELRILHFGSPEE